MRANINRRRSEVLPEIHAGVERRDLVPVAVEHQRRPASQVGQASLAGLAPARVIDFRVDVRVEPILAGVRGLPRRAWLLVGKADAHDRLDALEAVLPR